MDFLLHTEAPLVEHEQLARVHASRYLICWNKRLGARARIISDPIPR